MTLTGKIKNSILIEGILSSQNPPLEGELLNKCSLTGTLTPIKNSFIKGTLSLITSPSLKGKITIPFEVESSKYSGEYVITPEPFNDKLLQTAGFKLDNNITVLKIPYYKTSNDMGYTVYIGGN